jgi:tetratricopeptide (TPR) repeat protein/S1-C subfamily serine protease
MKSYLPIIASLFLVSTPLMPVVIASETEIIAQNIDPHIKNNIAREISVKITSAENGGSGVIIGKQDNTYLVLTNNHVLRDVNSLTIQTHDGGTYQATKVTNGIETNDDLALLEFSSNKSYQTATINSAATPKVEQTILAVGYSAETGKLVAQEGKIAQIPEQTLKDGYQIGYSSNILQGMSGGAILNVDGEVIGINGKSAFPILNTGYQYEDGTQPNAAEIEQYRQLSWGLSLNSLLAQLNPEIITAYKLPLPETTAEVETSQLTGWLGELEAKAKQITVKIDSSSGANGSGIIVAKQGNSYAVLTADHVVCERDEANKCLNNTYQIVTHDGKVHQIEINSINRQEGVDLALVRFTSTEQYQVAQLANYPVTASDAVFVAGYPKLSSDTPAQWQFSLGFSLDRETGLLSVNDSSLSTDSSGLATSQGSLSGGYEMVYTSITYGGMSGGAVLDREGRVIGIHGLAEGETALDSQDSSATKIQLGFSLGIPVNTFIGLADRLGIAGLPIQDNRPKELNSTEQQTFVDAILGTKIPQGNATAERWIERGNQLLRLLRYNKAVEAFDEAIALEPKFIHLAYYGQGLALWHEGELESALASLSLATEADPNFAPAFLYKSSILRSLNQLEEALVAIEQAISLQNNNANSYNEQGMILLNLKRYSEAEVAFNKAIQLSPRSAFYNNRGNLYDEQGKPDLALADYNRAISLNPNHALAYYNRGNLYDDQGKPELALADFNQAISINPNDAIAYNNRGVLYDDQGKVELALADYNKVIAINPNNAIAYYNRGSLYYDQGKPGLALADYNQAISLNPNYADAYNNRGVLYEEQGKVELALADYNRAIALNPNNADAYIGRGVLYEEQGKVELALADYNRAIALNPNNADAYNNRGLLYKEQGKVELALADYNKAIAINPNNANAYNNRGLLYDEQGKPDLALADYNKAIAINPNNANAYNNRGLLYQNQGKVELALADYNSAIALNSNEAYGNRAGLYQNQGKLDLALADYNQAISLNPNYVKAYNNRGSIYDEQGKPDLALADWTKAIALDPNYAKAYYNRGSLYKNQGKLELALADINKAIALNSNLAEAYGNLGLLYVKMGNTEAAGTNLQKAQELFTAQGNTTGVEYTASLLGKLYENQGETYSFSFYNPNNSNNNNAETHFERAVAYHEQGKVGLALADYNKAIALEPNFAQAYGNRGLLYKNQGKVELALADYNQAIALEPNDVQAYNNRGVLYQNQGKPDLALADWSKAIALNPNFAQAYGNRGLLYKNQGKLELALADYNQAIKLNPNDAQAYYNRGILYDDQGKVELALADYNKAIALNPNFAEAYNNRGLLYLKQGKLELALADCNKVISIEPNDAEAYGSLGLLYMKMGNIEAARTNLQKAQELFTAQGNIADAEQAANILQQLP